jgi:hypothetical protein
VIGAELIAGWQYLDHRQNRELWEGRGRSSCHVRCGKRSLWMSSPSLRQPAVAKTVKKPGYLDQSSTTDGLAVQAAS